MLFDYTPMAPAQVREPFHRDGWVYEEKVDGWRMLAYKDGPRVRLVSRNGRDHTQRFVAQDSRMEGTQMRKIQPIGPRWKRPILALLIGMSSLYGVGAAHGKECLKVNFPDQAVVDGTTLVLNGLGLRQATALRVNVYVAALYVAKPSTDADAILAASAPKQLVLHFVRNAGRSDLSKAWDEGFEANAKEQLAALKERIEKLKTLMADMKSGDQLSFTHKPGKGVAVDMGGATKGMIEGDDFAKALLSIWLGAHPPNAGLKTGLLGGSCG